MPRPPYRRWLAWFLLSVCVSCAAAAQSSSPSAQPTSQTSSSAQAKSPALDLYRQISTVGLDPNNVWDVRDASIDREDLHISLDEGTLAFTRSVDGTITGALFAGEGQVLIVPPNLGERASIAFFTRAAVLSEHFSFAYFRFSDPKLPQQLAPALRSSAEGAAFVEAHDSTAKVLAPVEALRVLCALTRDPAAPRQDFIRARISGGPLGTFDILLDPNLTEALSVGQVTHDLRGAFFDEWLSFPLRSQRDRRAVVIDPLLISNVQVRAQVHPPDELSAEAQLQITAQAAGDRSLMFDFSHSLVLASVERVLDNGSAQPLEWIQNPPVEGSTLMREGNDLVSVLLPRPLQLGEKVRLRFRYAGAVLSDAGNGLLQVGARGFWFPNRGINMAHYDLDFRYPAGWKLLATGKRVLEETAGGEVHSQWRSEQPIPIAGFNLGRYDEATASVDGISLGVYATRGVEVALGAQATAPSTIVMPGRQSNKTIVLPGRSAPAVHAEKVLEGAKDSLRSLTAQLGPFPYTELSLTQMPGAASQGWPGLVFLSSLVFLEPAEQAQALKTARDQLLVSQIMLPHEIAHQWWGDNVYFRHYRDEWLLEALANHAALLILDKKEPDRARQMLAYYRDDLRRVTAAGVEMKDAGPVTLGFRLNSSRVPQGYNAIAYGRGTWLIHMLREMFRDAELERGVPREHADDLFLGALRSIQTELRGKAMSTSDLQDAFEKQLPASLWFEGHRSLDWFFEGWVGGTAIPHYELKSVKIGPARGARAAAPRKSAANDSGREWQATASLLQTEAPDQLVTSIPIYAELADQQRIYVGRIFADGPETGVSLRVPAGTRSLLLDPQETVLRH